MIVQSDFFIAARCTSSVLFSTHLRYMFIVIVIVGGGGGGWSLFVFFSVLIVEIEDL